MKALLVLIFIFANEAYSSSKKVCAEASQAKEKFHRAKAEQRKAEAKLEEDKKWLKRKKIKEEEAYRHFFNNRNNEDLKLVEDLLGKLDLSYAELHGEERRWVSQLIIYGEKSESARKKRFIRDNKYIACERAKIFEKEKSKK